VNEFVATTSIFIPLHPVEHAHGHPDYAIPTMTKSQYLV